MLGMLLPGLLSAPPLQVLKRESPDFEVTTQDGSLFVELVDAIPDATSRNGRMNLAKRRSRPNDEPYYVVPEQFLNVIAREIESKRNKALRWQQEQPELRGQLVLAVNGGQAPLSLVEYYQTMVRWQRYVSNAIDPFVQVVVGDETGALVCI